MRRLVMAIGGAALCAVLLLAAGCSNKNNAPGSANGKVQNTAQKSAAGGGAPGPSEGGATQVSSSVTPLPTAERIGTVVASPSAVAATGAQRLVEVTTDNKYSQTAFTVKAGQPVELTLTNNGQAIHNWHLLNVKDKDGKEILTPLTNAGQSSTIDFTISTPGTYNFQCDVHPTEMKGTLKVQ